jgi:hypothetical protein
LRLNKLLLIHAPNSPTGRATKSRLSFSTFFCKMPGAVSTDAQRNPTKRKLTLMQVA